MTNAEINAALLEEVDAAKSIYDVDAAVNAWLYRTNIEERKKLMKVLFFEDHPDVAKMIITVLQKRRIQVKHFETLSEGKAQIPWCDVVLCDGTFPSEPGLVPTRNYPQVMALANCHEKGFVLFSGDDAVNDHARKNGISFLRKGLVHNEEILRALAENAKLDPADFH